MKKIHANISQGTSKAKNDCRARIDALRSRVGLLVGEDKLLMTMYLENGNSFRQIARLTGVNISTVARRIHKLAKRLTNGEYITCLRNREKFTGAELVIVKDYFLVGLTRREIAAKHNCSVYRVRKILKKVQHLVAAINK